MSPSSPASLANTDTRPGEIRTYRGRTLEELIPQIRQELGPGAVILRERQGLTGGIGGFFAKRCVEIEAQSAPRLDVYADEEHDVAPSAVASPALSAAVAEFAAAPPAPTPDPFAGFAQRLAAAVEPVEMEPVEMEPVAAPAPVEVPKSVVLPAPVVPQPIQTPEPLEIAEAVEITEPDLTETPTPVEITEPEALETAAAPTPELFLIETVTPEPVAAEAPAPVEPTVVADAPAYIAFDELGDDNVRDLPTPEPKIAHGTVEAAPAQEITEAEVIPNAEVTPNAEVIPNAEVTPNAAVTPAAEQPAPAPLTVPIVLEIVQQPTPAPVSTPDPVTEPTRTQIVFRTANTAPDAEALIARLTARGFGGELAAQILERASADLLPHDRAGLAVTAQETLAAVLPAPASLPLHGGAVAIVGSGGSGKSRAVAGLACALARAGHAVTVARLDGVEHGPGLTEILHQQSVELIPAMRTQATVRAVATARARRLVLIDTAAASPGDDGALEVLSETLAPFALDGALLCTPATFTAQALARLAEGFRALPILGVIATHADEAGELGTVAELSIRTGLPVAHVHSGLDLSRAVSTLDPARLAGQLLR